MTSGFGKVMATRLTARDFGKAVLFGVGAALAARISFSIPGIEGGVSDPREIIALISVAFFSHWLYPLLVGFIASLGGPWNAIGTTIIMHVITIPLAYVVYQRIGNSRLSPVAGIIAWGITVIILYLTSFPGSFVAGSYLTGALNGQKITTAYLQFVEGVAFEAVITSILTTLILALYRNQRETNIQTEKLNLALKGADLGLWNWNQPR